MMKKAILLTWEGFQDHEVVYPYHALKEHGFEVNLVANKKGRIYGILGCHMNCDNTTGFLASINIIMQEYELLVVPG